MTRDELAQRGREQVLAFCAANDFAPPRFGGPPSHAFNRWQSCGLYTRGTIYVDQAKCAAPGYGGRAWSWPGYVIDRTPFGVYCHELGHYFDDGRGASHLDTWHLSKKLRRESGEPGLTGYCPNSAEWFAEMFRLFVTNPDLLRLVRPATFELLSGRFERCETRNWQQVLAGAPARTVAMAAKKIALTQEV